MLPVFDFWRSGAAAAEVGTATHADPTALAALQARRLADLLARTLQHSRWLRRSLHGIDPSHARLDALPVSRKADLMAHFDEWVCDPALQIDTLRAFTADPARIADPFLGRYVIWESSGSSGKPGIFVQDAAALAVYDALDAVRRPMLQLTLHLPMPWEPVQRIAFLGATGGHFASMVSVQRLRRLNPALSASLDSVSFQLPTDEIVARLQALSPSVIATYPTAAVLLAEEKLAGRLDLALNEIWTGGENLSPAMRAFVQDAFGCPVINCYGASEFLSLAFECRSQRLHLNSDWVILEPVDAHDRPVAPGTLGTTTLLTNLANFVQPLIRYDIGDRVRIVPERCPCGSWLPVLEVHGRCDDSIVLQAPGRPAVRLLPLALCTVLEEEAGLFEFQLVQTGAHDLLLTIRLEGLAANASLTHAKSALARYLAQQGAQGIRIQCRSGVPAHRGRSDKLQRIVSWSGKPGEDAGHQKRKRPG